MGRYVPPEHEGTTSANKLAGKCVYSYAARNLNLYELTRLILRHALGARARKSAQGILTVRFEMPFAIWCSTCPKPTIIGQGVRFNAEKKRVGSYHSTPIFSFRMKHNVCGGPIEIRTDPKNTAYVVTEGAKKRDTGEDKPPEEGEIVLRTAEEKERLQNDAFAALEGKVEDKKQQSTDRSRIEELQRAKEKDWDDPYAASKKMRKAFRTDRKLRQGKEKITEALKDRMSLGMDLLDETEEDRRRAGFVDFGIVDRDTAIVKATNKPLFGPSPKSKETPKKHQTTKAESNAARLRDTLQKELENNTRAVLDPFLRNGKPLAIYTPDKPLIKRSGRSVEASSSITEPKQDSGTAAASLVDYDSD